MEHGPDFEVDSVATTAVRGISHIATLPEVTVKIIELVEDPSSSARDLHHLISSDPALTARMLKVVNSAFYGLPRQIASINRAVSLLGLNAVKNIAVAASLAKLFRGGAIGPHFDAHDLWTHCCATATAAQTIAKLQRKNGIADEAFLAGLVHDVGVLVALQYDQTLFNEAIERSVDGEDFRTSEQTIFGETHESFGKALCEHWKFPSSLAWVAGHHHEPLEVPEANRDLPVLIHVADQLAGEVAGGFTLDLRHNGPDPDVLDHLHLGNKGIDEVRAAIREVLDSGDELLSAA